MNRYLLLGLNHKTAPLDVREKVAFGADRRREAIQAFRTKFNTTEAVLLSTCNRVELYTARPVHGHPRMEEMVEFIAEFQQLAPGKFKPHLYEKADRAMVEHLFHVVSSLDSMVLGETQILGQVREAYAEAQELNSTGPMLNTLFQKALAVGKQVMHDTTLNEGRLSVASVAVDFANRIFDHFGDKTVLSIGAGKMSTLALRAFADLKPGRLLVCNRDASKAQQLAAQFGGELAEFEQLEKHLTSADVVISGTGAVHPIITRAMFDRGMRKRRNRPVFLIDIALPRDIEAEVGKLENVYLYNLDDLQNVVNQTQQTRTGAIEQAKKIVERSVGEFVQMTRTRDLGPMIDQLYKRYHALAQEELQRTLSKLPNISTDERAHLEELARRLVNKLLHDPIHAMKQAENPHGGLNPYAHAMERLFGLSEEKNSKD